MEEQKQNNLNVFYVSEIIFISFYKNEIKTDWALCVSIHVYILQEACRYLMRVSNNVAFTGMSF